MKTKEIINNILLKEEGFVILPSGKTECSLGYGWTTRGHMSLLEDLLDTTEEEEIVPDERGYKVETPYISSCLLPTTKAAREWLEEYDVHGHAIDFDPLEVNLRILRRHCPEMGKVYSRMKRRGACHWECREALLMMLPPPQKVLSNRIKLIV